MQGLWNGEYSKVEIVFSENDIYTVYKMLGDTSPNYIESLYFDDKDTKKAANILGINISNSISLSIFDAEDRLNPKNINSIYYNKIVNGLEIRVYKSYDGVTYKKYGTYYVDSWQGGFYNGIHEAVRITASDRLNTIGDEKIPNLESYSDIAVVDLLKNVLMAIGIEETDIIIDDSLDKKLKYGVTFGNNVREFINSCCQLLVASCGIDRDNKIVFRPHNKVSGNSFTISGNVLSSKIEVEVGDSAEYSRVVVEYLKGGDKVLKPIIDSNGFSLKVGSNNLDFIPSEDKILGNLQTMIKHNVKGVSINNIRTHTYQNGVYISCDVSGGAIEDCYIYAEGRVLTTTKSQVIKDIPNSANFGGLTFVFPCKAVITDEEANRILDDIVRYFMSTREIIRIEGPISSEPAIGDKITLVDCGPIYDGDYKLIERQLTENEDYNNIMYLVRYTEI